MDQKAFLNRVSKLAGLDREDCAAFQESLSKVVEDSLANGDTVSIPSFGNFEPRKRNERVISHPSSKGKRLLVPPKVVVNFKPSQILKNKINNNLSADEQ